MKDLSRVMLLLVAASCGGGAGAPAPDAVIAEVAACPAAWTAAPSVDPSIAVPSGGGQVLLHARAAGSQSYRCTATTQSDGGVTYAWAFTGPRAKLYDCNGDLIGYHVAPNSPAAPQWADSDGSVVEGKKAAGITPDTTAIPWLLLSATSHDGAGVMTRVAYVQRVNTVGGIAPSDVCDANEVGTHADIGYTADYYFFGAP